MHRTQHPSRPPHDGPRHDHPPRRLATLGHDHGARRLRRRRRRHRDARSHLDPPKCGGVGEGAGPGTRSLPPPRAGHGPVVAGPVAGPVGAPAAQGGALRPAGGGPPDAIVLRGDVVWLFPDAVLPSMPSVFEELTRASSLRPSRPPRRPGGPRLVRRWSCCRATCTTTGRPTAARCCGCGGSTCCGWPASGGRWPNWTPPTRGARGTGAPSPRRRRRRRCPVRVRAPRAGAGARAGGRTRRSTAPRRLGARTVGDLLTELAELMGRQRVVLAELDALGVPPPWFVPLAGVA